MDQTDNARGCRQRLEADPYVVDRRLSPRPTPGSIASGPIRHSPVLQRTVASHGMTAAEIERLSGAVRYMELNCQPRRTSLWLLTTNNKTPRSAIADIWKRITRLQAQFGLPQYSATTFETRGSIHAHISFIGTPKLVQRLRSSKSFGAIINVQLITEPGRLACAYLAKERTPQAGYRRWHILGGRLKGSHRLEGGGDRVRLSRNLEKDAIDAGYVTPWRHTNARR
jgi:hypothetical protein